jgi:tRNA nucleotidyltransferase (CCA-adding enzyme)
LILAKKIYPEYNLVRSGLIHPSAKHVYTLYGGFFDFLLPKDLSGEKIDKILIVDTCMAERVKEYFAYIRDSEPEITVIDHHIAEKCDILGATIHGGPAGANTTNLGLLAMKKGVKLSPEEATIALTGIYADTGKLLYENVTRDDYTVSAWLLDNGASLKQVKSYLETIIDEEQVSVLNKLLHAAELREVRGHNILFSYLEMEENVAGLAAVVEEIMTIKNPDAYFAVFSIRKNNAVLLIARSQKDKIDLHELLAPYGGGGHRLAGSAKIPGIDGRQFLDDFERNLETRLAPATRAADIMTCNVFTILDSTLLIDASMFLERVELTGAPVVTPDGKYVGYLGLRDIMKGRKAGAMKAPVTAYMSKPLITGASRMTMREIERMFYKHRIGHLPIVDDDKIVGIVSRKDYLQRYLKL